MPWWSLDFDQAHTLCGLAACATMKLLRGCVLVVLIAVVGLVKGAESAHALRQVEGGLVFHYGVIPAEVVLARLDGAVHTSAPNDRHLVVAVFDRNTKARVADAEVTVTVQPGKGGAVTRRLDPMKVADQPSYGGFFPLSGPGIYKFRFEARRPGAPTVAAAEFEYRVSPEGRRR
jgi:hypothetical protein